MAEELDELHIVSDLHLGGPPGKQIFGQTRALAGWIDFLEHLDERRRVGLVLNGDIVDFLAGDVGEEAKVFDPVNAVRKLDKILHSFRPVTEALRRFTARNANRHLVLVIGNHDVELTCPSVRDHLIEKLTAEGAKGRIHVALDGRGWSCVIGGRSVFCVHGNEYDDWNRVDYEQAAFVGEGAIHGKRVGRFLANGGTRLVIQVMNGIKEHHPFVDLLKPEDPVRLPSVVVALDRSQWGKVKNVLGPYATKVMAALRRNLLGTKAGGAAYAWALDTKVGAAMHRWGFLSEDEPAEGESPANERISADTACDLSPETLLERAEAAFQERREPTALVPPDEAAEMLGFTDWMGALGSGLVGDDPMESLRLALRGWMADDTTFDIKSTDEVFEGCDENLSPQIDFVVAGHTHLSRALRRTRGRGVYFNSGTWIRLLHADQHNLASNEAFRPFYEALAAATMDALDGFDLRRRTSVAIVKEDDGRVFGELRQVYDDGNGYWPLEGSKLYPLDGEEGRP